MLNSPAYPDELEQCPAPGPGSTRGRVTSSIRRRRPERRSAGWSAPRTPPEQARPPPGPVRGIVRRSPADVAVADWVSGEDCARGQRQRPAGWAVSHGAFDDSAGLLRDPDRTGIGKVDDRLGHIDDYLMWPSGGYAKLCHRRERLCPTTSVHRATENRSDQDKVNPASRTSGGDRSIIGARIVVRLPVFSWYSRRTGARYVGSSGRTPHVLPRQGKAGTTPTSRSSRTTATARTSASASSPRWAASTISRKPAPSTDAIRVPLLPRGPRLRQISSQGRWADCSGQSASASRTRGRVSRGDDDGAGRGHASGDSRRLD